ncbi:uncharacterized protein BDV14DRAFT_201277 [Aspergillus stella-maris]|uniref:uncharacterized protein n=1 Tax=Aspergillus stella-maris TaxID=1810926 RepID=UPI003CCDA9EC
MVQSTSSSDDNIDLHQLPSGSEDGDNGEQSASGSEGDGEIEQSATASDEEVEKISNRLASSPVDNPDQHPSSNETSESGAAMDLPTGQQPVGNCYLCRGRAQAAIAPDQGEEVRTEAHRMGYMAPCANCTDKWICGKWKHCLLVDLFDCEDAIERDTW